MKKIFLYSAILFLLLSCSKDFTSLAPISQRSVQTSYKTLADFTVSVNGAYDALQLNGTYGRIYLLLNEMRSDNMSNGAGASGLSASLEDIDKFREITTATEISNCWADSYKGIARCNIILDKIDAADIEVNVKNQFKGEALFIRSLLYYNLAVLFGNIPLQLTDISSPSAMTVNQVQAAEVYKQILADLIKAEGFLPAVFTGANIGRVTSGAVDALLGKIYLTTGDKSSAVTYFRKVISSQKYSLVSDYAKLWGVSNENGPESIFEVQFKTGGQGEGSGFLEYFASILGRSGGVGGGNSNMDITADMRAAYSAGDLRYNKSLYKNSILPDTSYVKKYLGIQSTAFDGDNNWVVFRYADVLLMLAEALGETTESYTLINTVRTRAGLPAISSATAGTYETKLLAERRVEFAFENQRWQDLLRFGVAKTIMAKHLSITEATVRLLYPVPQKEIDVSNGKIVQNPGF
ncbi:MAG: RagB/SusD family nutrient uptake outer membrane protein [Prolixibacteraceae bacterium]